MPIKIALAGNPNCGKTTMFNQLTGSSQYVGNWPGVTVEKKEGKLKGYKDVTIVDLPGIYSLSPYTLEEVVTRNFLINEHPDVIINLVDATNLERNLYLTTQLLEVGIPVVIALNMMDVVHKTGDKIDIAGLAQQLGCEIVETSALKGSGLQEVSQKAISLAKTHAPATPKHTFSKAVEQAVAVIEDAVAGSVKSEHLRFFAVKFFERDKNALEQVTLTAVAKEKMEAATTACEETLDDDAESIITNERYLYITKLIQSCYRKKVSGLSTSDKIDRIVTNRWLALPIFAAIMWFVYFISVTTVGTLVTDWTNDTLFGEIIAGNVSAWLEAANTAPWLSSLILDGIIGGVGAVLGFVPQLLILFAFLAVLEDCGYMARIAFIMDRIFRKFGLSGKSFIPIMIGTGCGVPGIMASRTIENEKDRRMTIMVTTFIPCSAKLPIIALIAGALFPTSAWVGWSCYFIGLAAIVLSGIFLKSTKLFAGDPAPFVMELPAYHLPNVKGVLIHMWDRSKHFITKAGTVIFISCAIVWFLSSFNWQMQMVDTPDSMLAVLGSFIAPVFAPLGFGNWQASVAAITGLVAKENVVGTFGVLSGIAEAAEDNPELLASMAGMFTQVSGFAFLVFNLLCAPCFAAIGAIRREMSSAKWTLITVGYQTLLAYIAALLINQLGSALLYGTNVVSAVILAVVVAALLAWAIISAARKGTRRSALQN